MLRVVYDFTCSCPMQVYNDLLRVGDGSGEGMVCSYFNTIGWPATLATSDQTGFITNVLSRKAKRVSALVQAGLTLRAGKRVQQALGSALALPRQLCERAPVALCRR